MGEVCNASACDRDRCVDEGQGTVILSVEERIRDFQGLSALESLGGLANGGVREVTSKSTGLLQCSTNHRQLVVGKCALGDW